MADTTVPADAPPPRPKFGLSGKLLVLTVLFVMLTEIFVYVPSIANFRINWLKDHLAAAHTAALVFEAATGGTVSDALADEILHSVGAKAVAMKMGNQRRLLALSGPVRPVKQTIDIREISWSEAVYGAFESMLIDDDDVLRVVGPAPMGGDFVEIVIEEKPLRVAMREFSVTVLLLSLFISAGS